VLVKIQALGINALWEAVLPSVAGRHRKRVCGLTSTLIVETSDMEHIEITPGDESPNAAVGWLTIASSYLEAHVFDLATVPASANRGTFFVFGSSWV